MFKKEVIDMENTCCLDCKDRHRNCHSNCEEYKEFKKKLEEVKQKRLKVLQSEAKTCTKKRNELLMLKYRKGK